MKKRSAVVTAGGLAASFMAGAAAVTFNWGMGTSSASTAAAAPGRVSPAKPLKPIVKHRTVVIHRKATPSPSATASASAPAGRTVVVPAPAPTSTPSKSVTTTGGSPTASGESDHEHEGSDD